MALTREDLQAIRALMQEEMEPIKTDISGVKSDLSEVKADLADIKQRVVKIEITQENTVIPKIQLSYEGISEINDRLGKLDKIEAKQEEHDDRIWALEQVVKAK